ncbi:MAG: fumarylacetoacetate hydrolase family protein [Proteobacteria bacterium]|nr:fumarylacetoacetate hydrolase family protein [Pseudomonadota bacterium]
MNKILFEKREIIPPKIVCVGRNFVEHISELGNEVPEEMVIFAKPNSAIGRDLQATHAADELHYEGELCFLIENGQFSAIGFGLDLTKRNLQKKLKDKGLPWERAKSFNGAALFSQFVKMPDTLENISFELNINNKNRQSGTIHKMIYKPLDILKEITTFMDLNDGDIIMTGTPGGVGPVSRGDVFTGLLKDACRLMTSAEWRAG